MTNILPQMFFAINQHNHIQSSFMCLVFFEYKYPFSYFVISVFEIISSGVILK